MLILIKITGTVSLETTHGQLQTVAECSTTETSSLLYTACPDFIATYRGTLDVSLVLKWTSQADMDSWLNRLIYSSFLALAEDSKYKFVQCILLYYPP